jgi:hypothetical protein
MLDVTSYTDKLPASLNTLLQSFAGGECVMVRKIKDKDKQYIKSTAGNCHINVKNFIEKYGGKSVSGWLLNRNPNLTDRGVYVWSFHSVWQKPDDKLLDVTDDKNYIGRDKSIFVPDSARVPDLEQGISYNNFLVFTEHALAQHYGKSIGKEIRINTAYWCDSTMLRLLEINEHSGMYRLVTKEYPDNLKRMCDEYEIDIVDGRQVPRLGSKYEKSGAVPVQMIFDYGVNSRG